MSLRAKIIKLAHEHPEFRKDLLPVLKTGSVDARGFGAKGKILASRFIQELAGLAHSYVQDPAGNLSPEEMEIIRTEYLQKDVIEKLRDFKKTVVLIGTLNDHELDAFRMMLSRKLTFRA